MSTNANQSVQNLGQQPFYDAFIDCTVEPKMPEGLIPIHAVIIEDRLISFNGEEYEAVDHKLFMLNALLAYRGAGFSRLRPAQLKKPAEDVLFDPFAISSAEQTKTFSIQIGQLMDDLNDPDEDLYIIEKDGHRTSPTYSLNEGLLVTDARPKSSKRYRPRLILPNKDEKKSPRGPVHMLSSKSSWYKPSSHIVPVSPLREIPDSTEADSFKPSTPEQKEANEPKEYTFKFNAETLTVRITPSEFAKLNTATKLIFAYSEIPASGQASHKLIDFLSGAIKNGQPTTAARPQHAEITKLHNLSLRKGVVEIDEQSGAVTLLDNAKTELISEKVATKEEFVPNAKIASEQLSPKELIDQSKLYLDIATKLAQKVPNAKTAALVEFSRNYNEHGFLEFNHNQLLFVHILLKREVAKLRAAKQALDKETVIQSLVNSSGEPLHGSAD